MAKSLIPKSKAKTAYGLLSEVRAIILAEPKRYDQEDWIRTSGVVMPRCGTVCCVGGWVSMLKGKTFSDDIGDFLGLDSVQSEELFAAGAAKGTPQTLKHARSGAAHITRFQKKYAAQLKAKRV